MESLVVNPWARLHRDSGESAQLAVADMFPISWSPDGKRIAFVADGDIYVVSVTDGSVVPLTNDRNGNRDPAWSPDGTRIAFAAGVPSSDIFVMSTDGSGVRAVTQLDGDEITPAWSRDGSELFFSSNVSAWQ
jgi:TolB protein